MNGDGGYTLLRLTNKCNMKCKFCNVWNEIGIGSDKDLVIKKKLYNIFGNQNITYVSLSGGEPLLKKQLSKYVLLLVKSGKVVDLQTNGLLLNREKAINLYKNGLKKFFISFHIHLPKIYNELIGLKGAWSKIFNNLKELDKLNNKFNDIEIILNPVFNKKTYKYVPDYFEFIREQFNNIRTISLSFIQPYGLASNHNDLVLDEDDYKVLEKKKWIYEAFNNGLIVNNPYCGLPLCVLEWYKYTKYCDEVKNNKKRIEQGQYEVDPNKYYKAKCNNCKWKYLCNGYWK